MCRSSIEPQIDASVARLGFVPDAFVFHAVSRMEDWSAISESLDRLTTKVRFRGVSSHHPDVVRAAIESGRCDLVMFAVGPLVHARYTEELLPLARARGVGTVCFKTFGAGKLVADTEGYGRPSVNGGLPRLTIEECMHATLTLDPDVALVGLSTPEEQDAAFAAAESFRPLSLEALADVRRRAAVAAEGKGRLHWDPA